MACEIKDLVAQAAWNLFLKRLKVTVAKKFGKRAAVALAAALADGPLPIGDILSLLILLWSIVDGVYGFGELLYRWLSWKEAMEKGIDVTMQLLKKKFGQNFLDNECACDAMKKYLKQVGKNMMANKKTATKRNTKALKQLIEDLTECLA